MQVECIGGGQRRFKFVEPGSSKEGSSGERSRTVTLTGAVQKAAAGSITRIPGDETTLLLSALNYALRPSIDERFSLVCMYGPLLQYVPFRLGRNKALDAATGVLTETHSDVCRGGKPTTLAISKYSHALRELRHSLDDPEIARSTETLCAAMILCISQVCPRLKQLPLMGLAYDVMQSFVGDQNETSFGHIQGLGRMCCLLLMPLSILTPSVRSGIMKHRGSLIRNPDDEFEQVLLASLRGLVILAAFWTDSFDFADEDWHALASTYQNATSGPELRIMLCAARVPMFIRRGEALKTRGHTDPTLANDVTACYESMRLLRTQLSTPRQRLGKYLTGGKLDYAALFTSYLAILQRYALAISVAAVLACVLSAVQPAHLGIQKEMYEDTVEVLDLAQRFSKYRPMGCGVIPLCLCTSWAATESPEQRLEIQQTLKEYMDEYPGAALYATTANLQQLERRLKMKE